MRYIRGTSSVSRDSSITILSNTVISHTLSSPINAKMQFPQFSLLSICLFAVAAFANPNAEPMPQEKPACCAAQDPSQACNFPKYGYICK